MPYVRVDANVPIDGTTAEKLLAALSAATARVTGKPERVVQVAVAGGSRMLMAGSEEPTAHVVVKGIGFPEDQAKGVSGAVCDILAEILAIPGNRVYIAFETYKGSMWGVDGGTY